MKVWIKYLIGIIIGIVLALIFPHGAADPDGFFAFFSRLFLNVGRYIIFPVVFFSLAAAVFELNQDKKTLRVFGRTLLYMAVSTAGLVILGTLIFIVIRPGIIPIIQQETSSIEIPALSSLLLQVFPSNAFAVIFSSGDFLLPLFALALLIGVNLSFDKLTLRPIIQLFDSASRILYHINSFIVEFIGFAFIVISAYFFQSFFSVSNLGLYSQLLLILGIIVLVVLFGIYPLVLYFLAGRRNPFRWVYSSIAVFLAGFISGNTYFTLGTQIKHGRESLGISRKTGAVAMPFLSMFARGGTAFIASCSFILILKSYSSLEVTFLQILWTMGLSFLLSFTLPSKPGNGVIILLIQLCTLYGRGIELGYLIFQPIFMILVAFATVMDVVTAYYINFLVAHHEEYAKTVEIGDFI